MYMSVQEQLEHLQSALQIPHDSQKHRGTFLVH